MLGARFARGMRLGAVRARQQRNLVIGRTQEKVVRYWQEIYQNNEDVFTQEEPNENLQRWASEFLPNLGDKDPDGLPARVLVPGCGRDVSMCWLAEQGVHVIGVDIAGEALRQFGNEQAGGYVPLSQTPELSVFQSRALKNLVLVHGDVTALPLSEYGGRRFNGVWDRGFLTALEPAQRLPYLQLMRSLLTAPPPDAATHPPTPTPTPKLPHGRILLEYLACNLPLHGSMGAGEAGALLEGAGFAQVKQLSARDVRDSYPAFNPPGLTYLTETVLMATLPA